MAAFFTFNASGHKMSCVNSLFCNSSLPNHDQVEVRVKQGSVSLHLESKCPMAEQSHSIHVSLYDKSISGCMYYRVQGSIP